MADRRTLNLYLVVDDDGDYGCSPESISDAAYQYNEEYNGTIVGYYHVQLNVPNAAIPVIPIAVSVPDDAQPGDITPISGHVLMVKPPE